LRYVALVLGFMGIPLLVTMIQSDRERLHRLSTERKEIVSDGGKLKSHGLRHVDETARAHMTLEKHHDLTRDRMFQKLKNASATEPVSVTIDGHPALQDELTGTEKGTNVVFLHTTVDDGDHFQQILAWTLKSRWQQQSQLLHETTATFHSEK
jgi:hypothetical protein